MAELSVEEVEDTWAIGCPIEAKYVPIAMLQRAVAEKRVQCEYFFSSMGSADLYWYRASSAENLERALAVVWPPGREVPEKSYDYDDRDAYRLLWRPFFEEQQAIAARAVAGDPSVLAEYARVLAELERAWMRGSTERDEWVTWLVDGGAPAELRDGSAIRHLVRGIRARWVRRDVEMMLAACIASIERFGHTRKAPIEREALRHELVQLAVRVARGRPWRSVAW